MLNRKLGLLGMMLFLVPYSVFATQTEQNFQVKTVVSGQCSIVSVNELNFGPYSGVATVDMETNLTVNCSSGISYKVGLNQGSNYANGSRQMSAGQAKLNYGLYRNAARTDIWDANFNGGNILEKTGTGNNQIIPIYGRLPSGQAVTSIGASYVDDVKVIVDY